MHGWCGAPCLFHPRLRSGSPPRGRLEPVATHNPKFSFFRQARSLILFWSGDRGFPGFRSRADVDRGRRGHRNRTGAAARIRARGRPLHARIRPWRTGVKISRSAPFSDLHRCPESPRERDLNKKNFKTVMNLYQVVSNDGIRRSTTLYNPIGV